MGLSPVSGIFLFVLETCCPQISGICGMLITSVSKTCVACWALREKSLKSLQSVFGKHNEMKNLWCVWELRISWEIFFDDLYAILRALPFFLFYAFFYENFQEQIFWSSWRLRVVPEPLRRIFVPWKKKRKFQKEFLEPHYFLGTKLSQVWSS